jgi:hypothetical protein
LRILFILLALLMAAPIIDSQAAWMKSSKESDQVYRKIYKLGYRGNYVITGEAKSSFYYSVEDGHVQYIQEKRANLKGKPSLWHPFKIMINIPRTALPENGSVIVTLYKKGEKTGTYPIVLEQFYH